MDSIATAHELDDRLNGALGDLYAYALVLDAQRRRLGGPPELTEEVDALRTTIAALRSHAERGPRVAR
ncbi:MAG: hypothetical protein JOY58_11855 [Solirubrobacterales bacterium]|nr:hypothetical protein [Solirubrobacterales bacterium]MBV9048959.1 hypothetical protein [Solirubrobacterales bacterium]